MEKEDVFDRLDGLLKERHMSRRALASLVGIKQSTLAAAFTRRKIQNEQVRKIAQFFGVEEAYLVYGITGKNIGGAEMIEKEARFGTWKYYRNEEGKARWKCSECGKIVKRLPDEKLYCSHCGAKMRCES